MPGTPEAERGWKKLEGDRPSDSRGTQEGGVRLNPLKKKTRIKVRGNHKTMTSKKRDMVKRGEAAKSSRHPLKMKGR